ncbi:MAG TPA: serine hydrolase [Bacteroidia bacterium]|nr:serine hydrolase [Bacteroidia bacterium]
MKKLNFSLLALLFVFAVSAQQPAFVTDSLAIYMQREMAAWEIPGAAVAIVKDGKVVVSQGYGVKEQGKTDAVNDETLFQIASCSKAFTATSLAILHVEKKLSLDDSVVKFIPGFRLYEQYPTNNCTVRDLLCHRIGLQTFQGDFVNWGSNLTRTEIVGKLAVQKPVFGFRAAYGYCNAAFLAAGEIIPVVTGKTWDQYVHDQFFVPLKMNRSSTTYAELITDKNKATGHSYWQEKNVIVPYDNIDNLGPAGSINSCVKDLANWLLCQLDSGRFDGAQVIPFAALQETRKPQIVLPARTKGSHLGSYCLGWQTMDYNGVQPFWHNGGTSGFVTTVCFIPELNLGIVVLTNTDQNNLYNNLRMQIIDAYLKLPYKNYSQISFAQFKKGREADDKQIADWSAEVAKKISLPVPAKSFAGTYTNPVYGKMIVVEQKGKLTCLFEHHPKIFGTLEYMGDSTFLCTYNTPLWGIKPTPFVVKDGKVVSMTISIADFVDFMPYEFLKEEK